MISQGFLMAKTYMDTLDVICHLQTPGWIILAMFLNVKCCCLCVHHHSYQACICRGFRSKNYLGQKDFIIARTTHAHPTNVATMGGGSSKDQVTISAATGGLWPPVAYGHLWLMASCGLWPPVAYGLLWLMAPL